MAFSASKPITLKQEQCHQTHWRNPLNQSVHIQRYTPVNQHSHCKIHLILDGSSPFFSQERLWGIFQLAMSVYRIWIYPPWWKAQKIPKQKRFMRFLNRDLFAKLAILIGFFGDIWMEYQVFGPLVEITQEIPPSCAGGGRHGRWNETTRLLQVHQGDEENTSRFRSVRSRFFFFWALFCRRFSASVRFESMKQVYIYILYLYIYI